MQPNQPEFAVAKKLSLYAGQGVGKIHSVVPAAERVAELARGLSASKKLQSRALTA